MRQGTPWASRTPPLSPTSCTAFNLAATFPNISAAIAANSRRAPTFTNTPACRTPTASTSPPCIIEPPYYHVFMPLHPQAKAVLDAMAARGGKPLEECTPEENRAARAAGAEAMAALAGPEQPVARVEDRSIPGPATGPIPVRIYWPVVGKKLPVFVYLHGGGWVFGNIESGDRTCRMLANAAECIVVNVEYRLAPEHKFPTAAEDTYAVLAYLATHAQEFDADPA